MDELHQKFVDLILRTREKIIRHPLISDKNLISNQEASILQAISENPDCIMKYFVEKLYMPSSTATGIVDRLVKKKLVIRKSHECDRRKVVLELTEEGRTALKNYKEISAVIGREVLENLTIEEQKVLMELFNII